jgi:hypothetical protein
MQLQRCIALEFVGLNVDHVLISDWTKRYITWTNFGLHYRASRRMRWAGHVAGMGEKRNAYRILESQKERDH